MQGTCCLAVKIFVMSSVQIYKQSNLQGLSYQGYIEIRSEREIKKTFILQIFIHRRESTSSNLPLQKPRIVALDDTAVMEDTDRLEEPRPRAKFRRYLRGDLHRLEHRQKAILSYDIVVITQESDIGEAQDRDDQGRREDVFVLLDLELP